VTLARLYGVPLACVVLEPSPLFSQVRAVLGVPCAILGLDESEAHLRQKAERLGVVIHYSRLPSGCFQRSREQADGGGLRLLAFGRAHSPNDDIVLDESPPGHPCARRPSMHPSPIMSRHR
jgi:hypothetical protein